MLGTEHGRTRSDGFIVLIPRARGSQGCCVSSGFFAPTVTIIESSRCHVQLRRQRHRVRRLSRAGAKLTKAERRGTRRTRKGRKIERIYGYMGITWPQRRPMVFEVIARIGGEARGGETGMGARGLTVVAAKNVREEHSRGSIKMQTKHTEESWGSGKKARDGRGRTVVALPLYGGGLRRVA